MMASRYNHVFCSLGIYFLNILLAGGYYSFRDLLFRVYFSALPMPEIERRSSNPTRLCSMRHIRIIRILFDITTYDVGTESNITISRGVMLCLDSAECLIPSRQVKHTAQRMFDILR